MGLLRRCASTSTSTSSSTPAATLAPTLILGLAAVALVVLPVAPAAAQPSDDAHAPIAQPFRLGAPDVEVELELRAQGARGQDDDDRLERDLQRLRAGLSIDVRQRITPTWQARAELQLRIEQASEQPVAGDAERTSLGARALFLQYRSDDEALRVRAGRQPLDDATGWFIDADVDGVRLDVGNAKRRLDLSLSREAPFDNGRDEDEHTLNALAALSFDVGRKSDWTPWILHRRADGTDGEDDAQVTWLGLQGVGRTTDRLRYWFNAGARRGDERRGDGGNRELTGQAIDIGATRVFQIEHRPRLTLGWARASGDASRADGDEGFRQSGLHTNEQDFGGQFDFRYLGEVMDPELANIDIATLGIGARATADLSIDLVYHRYRQREPDDRLRGADLAFEPSGDSDRLGDALDLVVGYDAGEALELQGIAGLFRPGDAFDTAGGAPRENAWLLRVDLEYTFEVRRGATR